MPNNNPDQKISQDIEFLIDQFDKFIHEHHQTGTTQDQYVLTEWSLFKTTIQNNPLDTQSHQKYVNNINNNAKTYSQPDLQSIRTTKITQNQNTEQKIHQIPTQNQIDKSKMKRLAHQLIDQMSKSNKILLEP